MNINLELNYILRLVKKNVAFSALCVFVISLGIGLSVTMYSVVSDLAYNPLPFDGGERFVTIKAVDKDTQSMQGVGGIDAFLYNHLRDNSQIYTEFGGFVFSRATVSDGDVAEQYSSADISSSLLRSTAVTPLMGRVFTAEDERTDSEWVVMISEKVWRNYYAEDKGIVGKTTRINGKIRTIIGVMPKGFKFPVNQDVWLPLKVATNVLPGEGRDITPVGIRQAGRDLYSANAEAARLVQQVASSYPKYYANRELSVVPYTRMFVANIMSSVYMLMGATLAVLLLVCMNMGNLLLMRANELSQEMAVRTAMGAGQLAIIKRVLLEFLVICFIGTILGLVLAQLGMQLVQTSVSVVAGDAENIPFWMSWTWRIDTVLAALAFSFVLWLLAGVGPAIGVSRTDPGEILSGGSKGKMASGNGKVTKILVGTEVVFSFFLLTVCGAFIAGISSANKTDFGAKIEGFHTASIELSEDRYAQSSKRLNYLRTLEQHLENKAGFESIAFTSALPSQSASGVPFTLEDRDLKKSDGSFDRQGQIWVSDNYMTLLDVELLSGRGFNSADTDASTDVVIIDEVFADRMWPGESALGKRVLLNPESEKSQWLTIVGVSSHVLQAAPLTGQRRDSTFYRPLSQDLPSVMKVVVQARGSDNDLALSLKSASIKVDRDIPLVDVMSLQDIIKNSTSAFGVITNIFSWIAVVTVILAAIGIYGVIARSVVARTSEIGVRMALGALSMNIIHIFTKQALTYIVIGLSVGGLLGVVTVLGLSQVIFGISSMLPMVLLIVAVIVGGLVLVASYIPAFRVVRIEPGDALHHD